MTFPVAHERLTRSAGVVILAVRPPYHLIRTLQCGQAFRWRVDGAGAAGMFSGRPVRIEQTAGGIAVWGLTAEKDLFGLRRYLGLDEPLASIEDRLQRDPVLRRIVPHTSGIALMRQDQWECLVSFIISAFNNMPKIELSLARLTSRFGDPLGEGVWGFPGPQRLAGASLADLRRCALGYRAPYVRGVARLVASGEVNLHELQHMSHAGARRTLLALPGVGEKVADCVLLFACGSGEAFPVDVWVKRAVERWYFHGRRTTARQIQEFARSRFGPLAGYAQQHLFYYIRERGNGGTRERAPARARARPQSGRRLPR